MDPTNDIRWFNRDRKDGVKVEEALLATTKKIRDNQSDRKEMDLHHARLYGDVLIAGLGLASYARGYRPSKLGFNVVKQCCDTLVAKIAKSRPLPMFLTSGEAMKDQKRAEVLNKFSEAQFHESRVFETTRGCALDTTVYGTGVVKNYIASESIVCERVYPWELLVDDLESQYGKPACMYHIKWIDRLVLAEKFPKKRRDIMALARRSDDDSDVPPDTTADQIRVTEGWHLRSGPNAKDGRHAIVVAGLELVDEPYELDYFPFSFLNMMPPAIGFWGTGVAQSLTGIQFEINFTAMRIQRGHRMMGGAHWIVPKMESLPDGHINNDIGTIWRYSVAKPEAVVVPAVHPDAYQYLAMLIQKSFEMSGISQLSSMSQKPAGLNSGKALQTYNDIETERFMMFGKSWEDFHLDIARQQIDLVKTMLRTNPAYAVKYRGKGCIEEIRAESFKDMTDNDYVMQAFPISALSKTPEGKMAQVQELVKAGWVDQRDAKRLLDFPDLDKLNSLAFSPYEAIDEMIEGMLNGGEYVPPEPFMDLEYAKNRACLYYIRARNKGKEPESTMEKLRMFAFQAYSMLLSNPQPTTTPASAMQPTGQGIAPADGSTPAPTGV